MMSQPLRVAVVARAVMPLHGVGGLERSVRDLVRHLAARGVDVTLITPPPASVRREAGADPFASPRIALRHVPYLTFPFANRRGTTVVDRSTSYLLYGYRAGRLAAALVRQGAIDVVHGFGASVLGYAGARDRARRSGARTPDGRAPLVFNPQGLEEFGATAAAQPALKRLGYLPLRRAVRRCARAADCIIATDRSLESTVARHLRPRAGQMRTLPNGIDLAETAALAGPAEGAIVRQRYGLSGGETVLLTVGRLEHNKGLDVLAAALGRARSSAALAATGWRWIIVGTGPFRHQIEAAIARHGIESHAVFVGRASEADLHAWYEAASLFVHPTRYEGSSLVTLEAMAHRRPIIATRAGGLPDKVRTGENGWLVEPDDADGLARAIEDAAAERAWFPTLGARSRQIVEQEFSWNVLVDRQIAVYRELLSQR
jgi:glycosyltransferase involved in cell wall biosynthesis